MWAILLVLAAASVVEPTGENDAKFKIPPLTPETIAKLAAIPVATPANWIETEDVSPDDAFKYEAYKDLDTTFKVFKESKASWAEKMKSIQDHAHALEVESVAEAKKSKAALDSLEQHLHNPSSFVEVGFGGADRQWPPKHNVFDLTDEDQKMQEVSQDLKDLGTKEKLEKAKLHDIYADFDAKIAEDGKKENMRLEDDDAKFVKGMQDKVDTVTAKEDASFAKYKAGTDHLRDIFREAMDLPDNIPDVNSPLKEIVAPPHLSEQIDPMDLPDAGSSHDPASFLETEPAGVNVLDAVPGVAAAKATVERTLDGLDGTARGVQDAQRTLDEELSKIRDTPSVGRGLRTNQ